MKNYSTQLLVVGGGATGLGIAWDASLRGIKTVLVEKGDIGEGTSGRYHGLLHSGGRYALNDPQSARECSSENLILRRIAPAAIEETGGYFVSTPTDPLDYPDTWLNACHEAGISVEEIPTRKLLELEPLLNPRMSRAFQVQDAALDSFDLAHMLLESIRQVGGMTLLHHKLESFDLSHDKIKSATVRDMRSDDQITIEAGIIINAAGPWAGNVAQMADIDLPLVLGKGAMIALANRLTSAVINRCKPAGDGDIIVPIGTVSVLGTTDVKVSSPANTQVDSWEIDLLLAEGEMLIPGISNRRLLRTWAGIRPLYHSAPSTEHDRKITRSHIILDHRQHHEVDNLISIFGGKLTTFRLMSEEAVDLLASRLNIVAPSSTREVPLANIDNRKFFYLPDRLTAREDPNPEANEMVICECELVTSTDLRRAIEDSGPTSLDDLRRELRLGMGPCQAAFCGYRASGFARSMLQLSDSSLTDFTNERWKGIHQLNWGLSLEQLDLLRRLHLELLNLSESHG